MSTLTVPRASLWLVELHNHAHLRAAYGGPFAAQALRALQRRIEGLGGACTVLEPFRLLVRLPAEAGGPASGLAHAPVARHERWQVALAAMPLMVASQVACPVVTIDPVREGGGGGGYPHALERSSAAVPCLAPPQFGRSWRAAYEREMALAVAFQQAMAQGRVQVAVQPIVRHDALGRVLYAECRLQVAGRPEDAPAQDLVPVLERLGLVRALDRSVVRTVLGLLEEDPAAQLGCQVSAHSLVADSWWNSILDRLAAQPEVAARLTVGITSSAAPLDVEVAVAFVQRLKALGCRIAWDDLGSGSVAWVRALRPDVIKLTASRCRREAPLFRQLAGLAQVLAPVVVATGVEHADALRLAFEAGLDWMQGGLLVPPRLARPCVAMRCEDAHWEAAA